MTNPIYDLYEAPASLKEIGLTVVAYLEDHVWKQSNAVAYLAMELGHTNALPHISIGKVTPQFERKAGWTGRFWIGAYRQFRTAGQEPGQGRGGRESDLGAGRGPRTGTTPRYPPRTERRIAPRGSLAARADFGTSSRSGDSNVATGPLI